MPKMEAQYTDITPENPTTDHLGTTTYTGGTFIQPDLAVDYEVSTSNQSKRLNLNFVVPVGVAYYKGTAWISEPLKKGSLGIGSVTWDIYASTNVTTVTVWLVYGVFVIDADNNLKYTLQNVAIIPGIATSATNYTGSFALGQTYDIEEGDRLVFEWWPATLNLTGSPVALGKGSEAVIYYDNNHTTTYDSQSDVPSYKPEDIYEKLPIGGENGKGIYN